MPRAMIAAVRTVLAMIILALAGPASADDARLRARLDPETLGQVEAIVASASRSGLPTAPLVATALEGTSKRAPGPRIVLAVRRHAAALSAARDAFGDRASESELVAGAGALLAGLDPDTLVRLRDARPRQSLVIPLVVLSDLLARSVPAGAAARAVLGATRAGARDGDLLKLRQRIEQDIREGASPAEAAAARARTLVHGTGIGKNPGAQRPGRKRSEVSLP